MEFTTLRPMLASIADVALDDPAFVYEPKYDGIRVLIAVEAGGGDVRLFSRRGNDKASQFPDLVRGLKQFSRKLRAATLVAHRIPKLSTVTRSVDQRGRTVYIDYLQNLHGKTLASVYSARASDFAGVSTPLTWEELEQGARPQDFTVRTVLRRFADTGDRWVSFRRLPGVDLHRILEVLQQTSRTP